MGLPVYNELRKCWAERRGTWTMELIEASSAKGGKEIRAHAVTHLFQEGLIHRPHTEWAQMVEDEMAIFPRGAHDDLPDCCTHGLIWLRDRNLLSRRVEQRQRELREDFKSDRSSLKALYPV